jgi:hypothetical protein
MKKTIFLFIFACFLALSGCVSTGGPASRTAGHVNSQTVSFQNCTFPPGSSLQGISMSIKNGDAKLAADKQTDLSANPNVNAGPAGSIDSKNISEPVEPKKKPKKLKVKPPVEPTEEVLDGVLKTLAP